MNIETICICGAGTMGAGIAQICAQSGFNTILYELNSVSLENAKQRIQKNLLALEEKQKIALGKAKEILERIRFTTSAENCIADLFIEAIIERMSEKVNLFNQVASFNKQHSIFATNTSSLAVQSIAEKIANPGRVIGMHFFNPPMVMRLVEVIYTQFTDENTKKRVLEVAEHLGKTTVVCTDSPGFIVNRVARPYYIEALRLVEEKIISIEQVDKLMEATGFRLGPFRLMDLIGNDINYAVSCSVHEQLGRPVRLAPSFLQQRLVEEGKLGKKSGQGYYPYNEPQYNDNLKSSGKP
jgi:3-hydroxybutyryl-CoA dehydrogenase